MVKRLPWVGMITIMAVLTTELVTAQSWYSSDWLYRRAVTVSNTTGSALTDHQVQITLNSSFNFTSAKGDGSDIQITASDGTTLLPFWIESWKSPTSASVWVKVPSIPTSGTTVYLYYGNSNASSASSAANTFIVGADFEDGTIDGLTMTTSGSATVSVPATPSQYMYGLKVDGWVKQPDPVLPKRSGKWDDYGTREISPVISESDGKVVVDPDGKITSYYLGRNSADGMYMAIGIAKSSDGGYTWGDRLDAPVIGPSGVPGSWYQWSVQQPSVLKRSSDGLLMMMAAGWTSSDYTSGSMGVFTSADGVNWVDQGQKLTLSQFHYDASNGIDQIGVPAVIKRSVNGDYFMLFEAIKTGASGQWRIFAATSSDFTGTWTPYNDGYPVFQETGTGWESWGVANPRLVEMSPNHFVMAYNGTSGSNWRIGFASTTDFVTWTRYANNPVLAPSLSWDQVHNETSFLVKSDAASVGKLYFNGFDGSGAPQVGLATNTPGQGGRVLHGSSSAVADGWTVGTTVSPSSPFIWEFLTQTPTDPISVNSGLEVGLGNWSSVPSPMDNVSWHAHDGINIQRLAGNAVNPGQFLVMYTNSSSTAYFWNGSAWGTTPTAWFGGPGLYKIKIWDDGSNYNIDLINPTTSSSILLNHPSVAKSSVRSYNLGRVIEVSEPFTNYYALNEDLDNWIVRKYASTEPAITVGGEQNQPPPAPVAIAASDIVPTGFTANWYASTGATSYQLDVATDNTFSHILSSYNNLTVSSLSQAVTGLSQSTTYYYRVRAINGTGPSGNSNTITVTTIASSYTLTYTAGTGGSISGTSPQTVNYGGNGTPVTAVPNLGYQFINWSDASTANPRTDINVMGDVTVTANFTPYTISVRITSGSNNLCAGIYLFASDIVDGQDTVAPPPLPNNYLYLYFLLAPGQPLSNYDVDIKKNETALATSAKHWDLRVISDQYGVLQTLHFTPSGLPPGFTPVLYDLQTRIYRDVRTTSSVAYTSPPTQDPYSFMLLIGDSTKPVVTVVSPNGGEALMVGTPYTIQWSSNDGTGVLRHYVYYSTTGTNPYTLIDSVNGNVTSLVWTPTSGSPGARIKVVARDSVMNEQTDISDGTFIINQTMTYNASEGWNLVSPPLQQTDMTPAGVFGDNYQSSRYYVFQYTPSAGYTVPGTLQMGQGYWLGATNTQLIDINGISVTSQSNLLVAGYNIIGDPFLTDEPVGNIQFIYNSQPKNWADAVTAGWLSNTLWGYNGTTYVSSGTSMTVWKGYWIPMIYDGVTIQYTPQGGGVIPKQAIAAEEQTSQTNWHVDLSASMVTADGKTYTDAIAGFGVRADIKVGFDNRCDLPRPPKSPSEGYVEVSFPVHGEQYPSALGKNYARIFVGGSEKPEWNFVVSTSSSGKVTLSWNKDAISALSNDVKINLYDATTHKMIDMKKMGSYTYEQAGTSRKFTINNANQAVPSSFQLTQNYPNPFNPTTVIRYGVPQDAVVSLEVYNTLGQKVASLLDGVKTEAGYHEISFDASRLASGLYLYRMSALGINGTHFTDMRKMLLMK